MTAPLGPSVTLACSETTSIPPANTTWKKGLQQEDITVGPKYTLSGEGPDFHLTIHNVSKDDEGIYFCRSENPLAVRELEVYLAIRGEQDNRREIREGWGGFILTPPHPLPPKVTYTEYKSLKTQALQANTHQWVTELF